MTYIDASTVVYTYDGASRLTQISDSSSGTLSYTYDKLDRLLSETSAQGTVSYTYDVAGRLASTTVAGQPTVTYTYDNADRLTSITQGSATVTIDYDAVGRRTSLTLPNGAVTEYGYDAASQLSSLTYKQNGSVLGDLTYEYDPAGRRVGMGGTYARTLSPQASTATYNAANQQTGFGSQTLSYDLNGNLLSDGTNTYNWNVRDQLVSMTGPGLNASFQYDAAGRRTSKTINGVTTNFLYDGANIVQELSGTTPSVNLLNGGIDEVFSRADSSGLWSPLTDALGSTLALTDASGTIQSQYTYDAFGKTESAGSNSSNASQYTGRENDQTGLYYYRNRYYSPTLQRFISEDPIGLAGGDNLYAYVGNNPVSFSDPLGLQAGPHNALRDPFSSDRWILNGLSNTLSDLLFLDKFAEWAWVVGDHCRPTSERVWAGAKILGLGAFLTFGGQAVSKISGKIVGALRGGSRLTAAPTLTPTITPTLTPALQNTLNHIFAKESHNLGPVVSKFGSELKALGAMQTAINTHAARAGLTGLFKEVVTVGGFQITISGAMINGVPRIATAFIP